MRVGYLGALVSSLLLLVGCFLFNQAPTAVIVAVPLEGESPLVVAFDGSDSTDPEGGIATYRWDFGDGTTSTDGAPHHTFLALTETKVFIVTLRVTDDGGASDSVSQSIEVRVPETGGGGTGAPVARITADRIIGTSPLTVSFSADGSEPGSGSITQVRWDFGDEQGTTGYTAFHTYRPEATDTFTVTAFVGNTEGLITAAQLEITVIVPDGSPEGDDPVAAVDMTDPLLLYDSPNPAGTPTLYEVTFSPLGSYADSGHEIDFYAWDFGDGEWRIETTDADVTHVYELATQSHTYIVRLIIYDDQGLEDTAVVNLSLAQPVDE
jgi:PKD repeat protein